MVKSMELLPWSGKLPHSLLFTLNTTNISIASQTLTSLWSKARAPSLAIAPSSFTLQTLHALLVQISPPSAMLKLPVLAVRVVYPFQSQVLQVKTQRVQMVQLPHLHQLSTTKVLLLPLASLRSRLMLLLRLVVAQVNLTRALRRNFQTLPPEVKLPRDYYFLGPSLLDFVLCCEKCCLSKI
jgi:hypothetical protein